MWGLILKQVGKIKGSVQDLPSNTAYGPPAVPVAVARGIDAARVEVQVVGVVATVDRTRPIVAVVARIFQTTTVDAATTDKPQGICS